MITVYYSRIYSTHLLSGIQNCPETERFKRSSTANIVLTHSLQSALLIMNVIPQPNAASTHAT